MNWEMISAVGQMLLAIGVIISIIYLAGQIRTSAIRSRKRERLIERTAQLYLGDPLACSPLPRSIMGIVLRNLLIVIQSIYSLSLQRSP